MGKLLWKEWHEIRLYLLGLVLGPWLVLLFPGANLGYGEKSQSSLDIAFLLLILAFWAATRMQEEGGKRNNLSTRTLPVSRGAVAAVKFLPGLLAAFALPFLMQAAGAHLGQSHVLWRILGYPVTIQFEHNMMLSLTVYCVAFLASMMASTVVAVGVSFLLAFAAGFAMRHIPFACVPPTRIFVTADITLLGEIVFMAGFATLGLFLSNPTARLAQKLRITLISILYALAVFFLVCFLAETQLTHSRFVLVDWACRYEATPQRTFKFPPWDLHYMTSSDGRSIAFPVKYGEKWEPYSGLVRQATVEVRVADARGVRRVVACGYAAPLASMHNGDWLVAASETGREMMLLRWSRSTGKTQELARFKRDPNHWNDTVIREACVSRDDSYIALFVTPVSGRYPDLWTVDTKARTCRLVEPSLDRSGPATWIDGRLVYGGVGNTFWSINPDGSGGKCVADLRRILSHD